MQPRIIREKLLAWYGAHRRPLPWRETSDPYAIWVSEVMLQQTQVATATPYYHRFMARFPSVHHLAGADLQDVLKLWEGLGYYSRARNLHRAAMTVAADYNGQVPDDPLAFRSLPGVGDYIAAAVLSIAFGRVLPVVDGNVKRVLARLLELKIPVNRSGSHKHFQAPAMELICPRQPADFNQALMELGALVCRPNHPDCANCPLSDDCRSYRHGTTATLPRREPSVKTPLRHVAIAVVRKNGRLLVVQRPTDGFLGGLWEFPAVPADPGEGGRQHFEEAMAAEIGLRITVERRLARIRHAYTHFRLSGDVYLCRHVFGRVQLKSAQRHRWVTLRSLSRLPLHKANHKFMQALQAAVLAETDDGPASGP